MSLVSRHLLITLSLVGLPLAQAQASDEKELEALMAMLDTETELATQNNMNADYVPGMVSVLHAEDLRRLGLATVAEALDQVAGFYVTQNNVGNVRVIARGVGATLNAGNLKILVDGAAVNRAVDASADWALRLPLEQVDRIEVMRGPGSAVHGEFAFSGVVNIISRQTNSLAAKGGSFDARQIDGHLYQEFANGLSVQLNLAAWERGNSGLRTNQDNFAGRGNGYSPGLVYDHEQGKVLQTQASYLGYQLQLQHAILERGPGYGQLAALPDEADPREETVTNLNLAKQWQPLPELSLDLVLSRLDTDLDQAAFVPIPKGVSPPSGGAPLEQDFFRQDGSSDRTRRANFSLHWSGLENHRLYADLNYADYQVKSSYLAFFALGEPKRYGTATQSIVQAGVKRELQSLTLQDQWQLSDKLEVTVGARHDRYDDWGSHSSPRLAAVWRLNDHHIVKAQYAEAFRPPTLGEIYPGSNSVLASPLAHDLHEETLRSSEASYIYRTSETALRSTVFYTQIDELIEYFVRPGQLPVWRNRGDIDTYGAELEWQQQLGIAWEWQANLAYVKAVDHLDTDENLLGAVDWQANLSLIWHSHSRIHHALRWRYLGEQEGWELNLRLPQTEHFDTYNTLDYTVSFDDFLARKGLGLSASIKNLTGETYNSVASPAQYPQGLSHGKRSIWLQLEYGF